MVSKWSRIKVSLYKIVKVELKYYVLCYL